MKGFIEIKEGLWYEESTGLPWSSRRGWRKLKSKHKGYFRVDNKPWHRMVWEYFNDALEQGYVVHHINHKPLDNRIENLQTMTVEEHNTYHSSCNIIPPTYNHCSMCGKLKKIVNKSRNACKKCLERERLNRLPKDVCNDCGKLKKIVSRKRMICKSCENRRQKSHL